MPNTRKSTLRKGARQEIAYPYGWGGISSWYGLDLIPHSYRYSSFFSKLPFPHPATHVQKTGGDRASTLPSASVVVQSKWAVKKRVVWIIVTGLTLKGFPFEVVDDQGGGLLPRFRRLLREAFIFESLEHPLHDRIIIIAIPSVDSLIYTGYSYDCVFPGLCNEPAHKPECAFQIELQ